VRAAEAKLAGGLSFYFSTRFPWLAVVALALAADRAPAAARAALRDEAAAHRAPLAAWAAACPDNSAAPLALVDAELARLDGRTAEALTRYEEAAARAQAARMLGLSALALERCGLHYLELGLQRPALAYLRDACAAYRAWEADAKVAQLQARHPQLRGPRPGEPEAGETWTTSGHSSSSTRDQLDLTTAFKGAQALASEMNLERLLAKVVPIAIENSGAERGVLVLSDADGALRPAAESGQAAGPPGELPMTVARATCRTGATVVLGDASADAGAFRDDPYLRAHRVRSLICTPLVHQGHPLGALYLENSLTAGVFTAHHMRVLHVLASQAAIAIENARLYTMLADANRALEQRVALRTAELTRTLERLQATQHQLVEAEKMAALGTLVAGIAHEINTPVGVSVTAASVLLERSDQVSESYRLGTMSRRELERYFQYAHQSSTMLLSNLNRAAELIQSFKQVAVDQSSEEQRTFEVRAYIEHVLLSLRPELKRTRHRIDVDGDPAIKIHSFPGALSQILTNLIMNSLVHAYAPDEVGTLTIAFSPHPGGLTLEYADDGRGIDAADLGRIFDPFFTTRRDHGGSGLGLHIVYNLVTQRLGGAIRCDSAPGQGVRFTLTLADRTTSAPPIPE
jgi:signal transduction histidine kinase